VPAGKLSPTAIVTDVSVLKTREMLVKPQSESDPNSYLVWHKTDSVGGPEGKYLVDHQGKAVWFVDPGINGNYNERPDGSKVTKLDAPKAVLVSYIIKGILDHKLPWALVLLGVMIAVTLELSGIPSLAFAVGVYLPISSSTPIFVGGLIRWLVDRYRRRSKECRDLSEEKFAEESDKSSGVLLASGYIAGGAIAGIVIAYTAARCMDFDTAITKWSSEFNPFFSGAWADALSMIPFVAICGFLYLVARGKLLAPKAGR